MAKIDLTEKLAILADAAKYDASCASSGTQKRHSRGGGIGSTEGSGICHAYAPDGRCISLLKILLTNVCIFDCAYCINRQSSNVRRARFTADEVVTLTLDFYRRNYIEGLFLSSGIIGNCDYTMEQIVLVARTLRVTHEFRGYIHLKTIPDASPELLAEAGRWADRLSINVELPTRVGLEKLAPEKKAATIRSAIGHMGERIAQAKAERKQSRKAPVFAPAGQSTQMIIGADSANDAQVLGAATDLYGAHRLRRVYYSAYSPIPDPSRNLPPIAPPLAREHRLYQADWLLRFYGFSLEEIMAGAAGEMLDLDLDPKLAWALRHRGLFPINVNRACREQLLRLPGLGTKGVARILKARRHGGLRYTDLAKLTQSITKLRPFVETLDWRPRSLDAEDLVERFRPAPKQLDLFPGLEASGALPVQ